MNLHGIVSGAIGAVNPHRSATLKICTGYTTSSAGRRTPTYAADLTVMAQVQDLSQRDVRYLEGLGIQGSQRVMYLSGSLSGLNRPGGKGQDLVVLDGESWMVTAVMEQWPDWAKVAVTLQNGAG